jgi:hypothetical protein
VSSTGTEADDEVDGSAVLSTWIARGNGFPSRVIIFALTTFTCLFDPPMLSKAIVAIEPLPLIGEVRMMAMRIVPGVFAFTAIIAPVASEPSSTFGLPSIAPS